MLLDGLGRLCCSAHGEHMSWTPPFTEKPRQGSLRTMAQAVRSVMDPFSI